MQTQELSFERVNLAIYNPRVELEPEDQEWKDIEASLDEFGQVVGMVWNTRTGNVVGGHQRIRILKHRGKDRAFFTVVDLDPEAEKRLNVILNKVSGRWSTAKLTTLLGELKTAGLDVQKLGFRPVELQTLLGSRAKRTAADPNAAAPGKPAIPRTQLGDLWEFTGESGHTHRLLCGDCRSAEAAARLMTDQEARLIFTDPPYNVSYDNRTAMAGARLARSPTTQQLPRTSGNFFTPPSR